MSIEFPKEPIAHPLPVLGKSIESVKKVFSEAPSIEETPSQEIVEELMDVNPGDISEGVKEATKLPPEAAKLLKTGVSNLIEGVNKRLEVEGSQTDKSTAVFKRLFPK